MIFSMKFDFNDPLLIYRRFSTGQCFLDPGTAMALAGGARAGGDVLGGILGSRGAGDYKKTSTLSKHQKQIDKALFDFLMGINRDEKGREISRDPLLAQLANRKLPQRRIAPMTGRQKNILAMAESMAPRVVNRLRPDVGYQRQLAQGILPSDPQFKHKPRYMAKGGLVKPGEAAIVGDDGVELIEAMPKGGVKVIPNPKTAANPANLAAAMAKSKKIEKATGKRALGTGTSRRYWDDPTGVRKYLDYDYGGDFGKYFEGGYGDPMRGDYEKYLADQYGTARGDYLAGKLYDDKGAWSYDRAKKYATPKMLENINWARGQGGKSHGDISKLLAEQYKTGGQDWVEANFALPEDKRLKGDWDWYEDLIGEYGGDISSTPYVERRNNPGLKPSKGARVHEGYLGGLSDYWGTLPTTTNNQQLDDLLASMPAELRADFGSYISQYPAAKQTGNLWTQAGGDWTFTDPYDVDMGNLNKWVGDYVRSKGYEANLDYLPAGTEAGAGAEAGEGTEPVNTTDKWIKAPPTETEMPATPVDYSGLIETLAGGTGLDGAAVDAVNEHLTNWKGGVLSDYELSYDLTTSQYAFGSFYNGQWVPAPDNIEAGLTEAINDYAAGNIATAPDTGAGAGNEMLDTIAPILTGIMGAEFDTEKHLGQYKTSVVDPANKRFTDWTVPSIEQTLGGGEIRGSAREKYIEQARKDLDKYLISEQSDWMKGAEDTFENRRQLGINQAMTFAMLPTAIANAQISGEGTRAMIANTFNNMAISNAIADSNITNAGLSGLITLWELFGAEQLQTNNEWAAEFANAFIGPGPVALNDILGLLIDGYQSQNQTAVVTS